MCRCVSVCMWREHVFVSSSVLVCCARSHSCTIFQCKYFNGKSKWRKERKYLRKKVHFWGYTVCDNSSHFRFFPFSRARSLAFSVARPCICTRSLPVARFRSLTRLNCESVLLCVRESVKSERKNNFDCGRIGGYIVCWFALTSKWRLKINRYGVYNISGTKKPKSLNRFHFISKQSNFPPRKWSIYHQPIDTKRFQKREKKILSSSKTKFVLTYCTHIDYMCICIEEISS